VATCSDPAAITTNTHGRARSSYGYTASDALGGLERQHYFQHQLLCDTPQDMSAHLSALGIRELTPRLIAILPARQSQSVWGSRWGAVSSRSSA